MKSDFKDLTKEQIDLFLKFLSVFHHIGLTFSDHNNIELDPSLFLKICLYKAIPTQEIRAKIVFEAPYYYDTSYSTTLIKHKLSYLFNINHTNFYGRKFENGSSLVDVCFIKSDKTQSDEIKLMVKFIQTYLQKKPIAADERLNSLVLESIKNSNKSIVKDRIKYLYQKYPDNIHYKINFIRSLVSKEGRKNAANLKVENFKKILDLVTDDLLEHLHPLIKELKIIKKFVNTPNNTLEDGFKIFKDKLARKTFPNFAFSEKELNNLEQREFLAKHPEENLFSLHEKKQKTTNPLAAEIDDKEEDDDNLVPDFNPHKPVAKVEKGTLKDLSK